MRLQKRNPPAEPERFGNRLSAYLRENYGGTLGPLAALLATEELRVEEEEREREGKRALSMRERDQHKEKSASKFTSLLSRWRAPGKKSPAPSAKHLGFLCKATGVSLDNWLGIDNARRYPWMPEWWTPENVRVFARELIRASATQILAERREDLDALAALGDDDVERDILDGASAATLATVWLGEMHNTVREHVERELDRRFVKHLASRD